VLFSWGKSKKYLETLLHQIIASNHQTEIVYHLVGTHGYKKPMFAFALPKFGGEFAGKKIGNPM